MLTKNEFELRDIVSLSGGSVDYFKLNNLVFLIQELANPFTRPWQFEWKYGIRSFDVQTSIRIAKHFGLLEDCTKLENGYRIEHVKIKDSNEPTALMENEQLQELVPYLCNQDAKLLDVASCILWLKKEGLIGQEINSELNDFKGHLKDLSDEAFKLVEKDRKIMLEYN